MTRYEDGVGDIRDHYGVITCLSFSSDGTMLASCGEDARSGLHFLAQTQITLQLQGDKLCLYPDFFLTGWRSELAGCRSTLHVKNKSKDF